LIFTYHTCLAVNPSIAMQDDQSNIFFSLSDDYTGDPVESTFIRISDCDYTLSIEATDLNTEIEEVKSIKQKGNYSHCF
jgi:hypothetical protein